MGGKLILNEMTPYKQGMQIDEVKKKYGLQHIVKLASNENPYGYSEKVKEHILASDFEFYPDGYASELRTTLAKILHVNEEQIVFGSGSDEIVQMISRAFLFPQVNTIMSASTFPQYKHNALIEGATIKEISTIHGYHNLDGILGAINDKTAVIWLCSPDNPTGTLIQKDAFHSFMKQCPRDILVVLDEAYYEFINPEKDIHSIAQLNQYPNLIILRTFSKAYGLAGLRIGYGIAHKNIADKLNIVRPPFNTTKLAHKAALIALEDKDFIQQTVLQNKIVKQTFEKFLDRIGWSYYESQTNFILVCTPVSGTEVFQYLLENGFIVRPGELLGYPNTIRVTIGNEQDMKKLQDLLSELNQRLNKETLK